MTQALATALLSAMLAAVGGFATGVALRVRDDRREQRVAIFLDALPACHKEVAGYVGRVHADGTLATMSFDDLIARFDTTYRAAMVASRRDEAFARPLAQAANDLRTARSRYEAGDRPRRMRDGGWAKLAWDTISQAEVALHTYESWLTRRLLARRPLRATTHYQSIEIDRDLAGEDSSRFARPASLSTEVLRELIGVPFVSWAVVTGDRLHGHVLVIWMTNPTHAVLQRLCETDEGWLHPIGPVDDPGFPGLWRVAAQIQGHVAVPTSRQVETETFVIPDYPIPPQARAEIADYAAAEAQGVIHDGA